MTDVVTRKRGFARGRRRSSSKASSPVRVVKVGRCADRAGAGCDNPDILDHCRDPHATHVRGCWVVDLVLGKA